MKYKGSICNILDGLLGEKSPLLELLDKYCLNTNIQIQEKDIFPLDLFRLKYFYNFDFYQSALNAQLKDYKENNKSSLDDSSDCQIANELKIQQILKDFQKYIENSKFLKFSRKFIHKFEGDFKLPMTPSQIETEEKMKIFLISPRKVLIHSDIFVKGIMYCDCFINQEQIFISSGEKDLIDETSILVSSRCKMIKSTFFKSLIISSADKTANLRFKKILEPAFKEYFQ